MGVPPQPPAPSDGENPARNAYGVDTGSGKAEPTYVWCLRDLEGSSQQQGTFPRGAPLRICQRPEGRRREWLYAWHLPVWKADRLRPTCRKHWDGGTTGGGEPEGAPPRVYAPGGQ